MSLAPVTSARRDCLWWEQRFAQRREKQFGVKDVISSLQIILVYRLFVSFDVSIENGLIRAVAGVVNLVAVVARNERIQSY